MSPAPYDLSVYQGDRFELYCVVYNEVYNSETMTWDLGEVADLTGWLPRGQVRETVTSTQVSASFTCALRPQDGVEKGAFTAILHPADTRDLAGVNYVYDLELYKTADPTTVETYLAGKLTLTKEVTRVV